MTLMFCPLNTTFFLATDEESITPSVDTTESSIEESIIMFRSETERRKKRLRRLRHESNELKLSDTSEDSFSFQDPMSIRSIMTVRTKIESLRGGQRIELKKKRRRLKLKLLCDSRRNTSGNLSSKSHPKVQFDAVNIREYPVIPGDNPAVSEGPPLTLGWTPSNGFSTTVDTFEKIRRGNRRYMNQMKMPSSMRVTFLIEQEYPIRDIAIATRQADIIRSERLHTMATLDNAAVEERIEALKRIFTKPFRRKQTV
jgi:hypothetical protein